MSNIPLSRQTERNRALNEQGLCIKCREVNEDTSKLQCPACREKAAKNRLAQKVMAGEKARPVGRPRVSQNACDALYRAYMRSSLVQLDPDRVKELVEHPQVGPAIMAGRSNMKD